MKCLSSTDRFFLLGALLWILLLLSSLCFAWVNFRETSLSLAIVEAKATFAKDLVYRRWATMHGGVYVPPTERTPPNPNLSMLPHRDVVTAEGKRLTLINPAYMTRQVHEMGRVDFGIQGHITSLHPIRLENAADAWETKALQAFERGVGEASELVETDGKLVVRYMRPMITEEGCLKCHAQQGYRVGDIRGGISVTVPLSQYLSIEKQQKQYSILLHGLILNLGLLVIWLCRNAVNRSHVSLKDSEYKYRTLVESAPLAVCLAGPEGVFHTNTRALELFGCSTEDFHNRHLFHLSPERQPDGTESTAIAARHMDLAKGGRIENFPWQFRRLDGTCFDAEVSLKHLDIADKSCFLAIIGDVTKRIENEREFLSTKHRLEKVFNIQLDAIFILDRSARIVEMNQAVLKVFGYVPEELRGRTEEMLHIDEAHFQEFQKALSSVIPREGSLQNFTYTMKRKDNTHFPTEHAVLELLDDSGNRSGWVSVVRDVTDRKKMEAQLRQASKMESIGQLAGGVAHDINNMLAPIIGYAEMLTYEPKEGEDRRKYAQQIIIAATRVEAIVRQLLAFSRKQTLKMRYLDLNSLLLDFKSLLRRTLREDITLHFDLADPLQPIYGDGGQLEQVVMNLSVNAQDALPQGGELRFQTCVVELSNHYDKAAQNIEPGVYVLFSVTDNGVGIEAEICDQIFEPFFTTKQKYKGTGLGLATVYGIIKQHFGYIFVFSEPGRGTTFEILLPVAKEGEVACLDSQTQETIEKGHETILLVEDENQMRTVTEMVLTRQGYRVLSAAGGREAISLCHHHTGNIDLLLTDVIMPEMDGRQVASQVRKIHPQMRVLYMSGYSDDVISTRGILEEGIQFVQKPFSAAKIGRILRQILDC